MTVKTKASGEELEMKIEQRMSKALHEEGDRCYKKGDCNKALELLTLAKKWQCSPGILWTRSNVYLKLKNYDLAYLDVAEALGMSDSDSINFYEIQELCLRYLGYKVIPQSPRVLLNPAEAPAHYEVNNWQMGLRLDRLAVSYLSAVAITIDGKTLMPLIPLGQLAQFLDDHVQDAVWQLTLNGGAAEDEGLVLQLLDQITVPERLYSRHVSFRGFFHLSWTDVERLLNGKILQAHSLQFLNLRLPSGVDEDKLQKLLNENAFVEMEPDAHACAFLKLPAVRECSVLCIHELVYPPPPMMIYDLLQFPCDGLLEWMKRSDDRLLGIASDYLRCGLAVFLDTLKEDFEQAEQEHSFTVKIYCPNRDVDDCLVVQNQELLNQLGEKMEISVGEDPEATMEAGGL